MQLEAVEMVRHPLIGEVSAKTTTPLGSGADGRNHTTIRRSEGDSPLSKAADWKLMAELKNAKQQTEMDKRLGITWHDLTIKGTGTDVAFHENFGSQFNIPIRLMESRRKPSLKTIVDNSHGCVKPGEMLLVLGRPGAGCTSLLNILANRRSGYAEVTGQLRYGSMTADEAKQYRGQIVMNTEEELFFPTLTVEQTIDFATRLKVPHHLPSNMSTADEFQQINREFLLRSMGIEHTRDTKVGNEFVRGVSGGERKRVSIMETLATRGSVFCWDNSTRGLDASTALEYVRCIRAMTDVLGLSSIVTLYQAGNGIYNLFDKVLLLDEGKQTFYGPLDQAKPFMEDLGFFYTDGANIADYLTGVTVPTERRINSGMENQCPRNAEDLRSCYEASQLKRTMALEYNYPDSVDAAKATKKFQEAVRSEKNPGLSEGSQLTVSFYTQVKSAVIKQYQLLWGNKTSFLITQGFNIVQALITGSLFYDAPNNSSGLLSKGGSLFFAMLYNSLLCASEVPNSFAARPILAKHRGFALYHPAAFCIAQITADLPLIFMQVTLFGLPVYWLTGLKATGEAFMTYWIFTVAVTMCMTALFRATGAAFSSFDAASKVSGFLTSALIMYTGFMIPKPSMHPWFVWIYWINPLAYGFEAILSNEFHGQLIPCVDNNLVPNGPGYNNLDFQACTGIRGAPVGASVITGDQYLRGLSYSHAHVWRNFGIVWAWWALFVILTIYFTSNWSQVSGNSGYLVLPREKAEKTKRITVDEEAQSGLDLTDLSHRSGASRSDDGLGSHKETSNIEPQLIHNTSIFTWKGLYYTVKTSSGDRVLLDNIQGWVKPGMLGALMGSSGAGKTTLLDVLAQRKTEGYCEQLDVHEPLSTVREALEFSALLRQSRDTPIEQKLKYVDTIIDLLEMHDIENTLIGTTTAGLSVEQRKRLTIGVELVSKPSILIFLDEPTSGLDGQAAFNIVRFLRKLADAGQAVLVTIHQPSASLFAQFDTLLLLAKGGKTVYFGDIGDGCTTVKQYFARNGAPCPQETNPAEHMIDVVSRSSSTGKDWNEIWLASPEYDAMTQELDRIISDASSKPPGTLDDGYEFATPIWTQIKLVTKRNNISLWRNTNYINNKCILHISSGLLNGFTFWMLGNSVADLQMRLFTIFNFIFVAPGAMAQLQPLFIARRDIYEVREKKSKMYHWSAFATALIVSELPYLVICAVLYYAIWYYTVGFPNSSDKSGAVFLVMLMYELIYTGIGQAIAAYTPDAVFASLINPLVIGTLVAFCGVYVPFSQIQEFWRYWLYYLNPFTYLMGSMLVFTTFDAPVHCGKDELAVFNTPEGQTCGDYLSDYMQGLGSRSNLLNPTDTQDCKVCQYRTGSDYLFALNLNDYYYGWRDTAIVVLFAISSYSCVYALM
ncbi:ABC multidrug transporter atrB [Paramyrothecium foliicola]|nr:ABC multidrug transporter atrB [Paramyrothecium foliicola]